MSRSSAIPMEVRSCFIGVRPVRRPSSVLHATIASVPRRAEKNQRSWRHELEVMAMLDGLLGS
jgi:hypothetical protein